MKYTRRNRFVVFGVLGLAVVALTIGLSVDLTQNRANNSTTESAAAGSTTLFQGSTSTGTASTSTTTGSTTIGTTSTPTSMDSTSSNTASTTTSTSAASPDTASARTSYTTSTGTMEVSLKLFNPNITIPYADDNALKADLTEAAKLLVINIIKSYTEQQFSGYGYYYYGNFNSTDDFPMNGGGSVGPTNFTTTRTGGEGGQFTTEGSSEVPVLRYVCHAHEQYKLLST